MDDYPLGFDPADDDDEYSAQTEWMFRPENDGRRLARWYHVINTIEAQKRARLEREHGPTSAADDGGAAHEPLSAVGEHFPASWDHAPAWERRPAWERTPSWEGPTDAASYATPCELTRLRAEVYALREMEAALRVSLRDAMQKIEDMTPAKPAAKPLPIHRALGAKPPAFGLRLLSD